MIRTVVILTVTPLVILMVMSDRGDGADHDGHDPDSVQTSSGHRTLTTMTV